MSHVTWEGLGEVIKGFSSILERFSKFSKDFQALFYVCRFRCSFPLVFWAFGAQAQDHVFPNFYSVQVCAALYVWALCAQKIWPPGERT